MNQPKKERFKTSVGGQALMEGIMMRGPKLICCAVRKPDGTIETKIDPVKNHGIWTKIPPLFRRLRVAADVRRRRTWRCGR